jgi:hypothetical protein
MHGAATRDHEHMADALPGESLGDIISDAKHVQKRLKNGAVSV